MLTIAVAMSGGVDSSAVAAILAQNNSLAARGAADASPDGAPAVVGLTMQLWNQRRLPRLQGLEEGVGTPGRATVRWPPSKPIRCWSASKRGSPASSISRCSGK